MSDDLRSVLSEKFDSMTAEPAPAPEPVVEAAPEVPAPTDGAPPPAAERPRDESGRFVKSEEVAKEKPKAAEIGKAAAAPEGAEKADKGKAAAVVPGKGDAPAPVVAPPEPVLPPVKAPQSWTAEARAELAKAPPAVQREVAKREAEITRTLSETAEARKVAETVHRTLAPFEGLARSQGMDAMSYAGAVMQTAAALHMGAPAQKEAIVAHLIATYGIDVEGVNRAMQNPQVAQQAMQRQAPPVDPREEVRRILAEERINAQAQEFLANPPEFYDTVKTDMHEMLRLDRARGGNMTPQQAYEKACRYSDEVQGIKAQRKAAEDAQAKAAEFAKAKAAAGSVRTQPASPPPPAPTQDRRAVLEAEFDRIMGG